MLSWLFFTIALLPTGHVQRFNLKIIALLPMGLNELVPFSHMIKSDYCGKCRELKEKISRAQQIAYRLNRVGIQESSSFVSRSIFICKFTGLLEKCVTLLQRSEQSFVFAAAWS